MTDNKEGKEVYDHIPHTLGGKTSKDQREVCPGCGYAYGIASRDNEVGELKAKIAGLEGRIQGMLESRDLGK